MKKIMLLGVCLLSGQITMAQPPPPPMNPTAVPIDGGLGLLLAAGAGLGARKVWKSQQNQKS